MDADFMRRVLPPASYDRYTAALAGYRAIVRDLVVAAAPQSEHDPAVNLPVLVSALIEMVDRVVPGSARTARCREMRSPTSVSSSPGELLCPSPA